MAKVLRTLRTHWKKSIFFSCCFAYASKYAIKWHNEDVLMRQYCLKARDIGRQTITASERPRKVIVFLNPAAKEGKTKYLLEKHVLPLLHLAGIEIHVVRTEHEGQAKAYMGVLDHNIVDAVVVAGGDGTLSEIVTGLLRREDGMVERLPIGVLPFGKTNTFASRIFPLRDLEVERFCQASMAIIGNKYTMADVIEVQPIASPQAPPTVDDEQSQATPDSDTPVTDKTENLSTEEQAGNRNIYLLSNLKWGVHSDIARRKSKYWYMPGPLKEYYCYLKSILFGDWPPHVRATIELSPPCDGCTNCFTAPAVKPVQKPAKSVWWWPTDYRLKHPSAPSKPDPRLQAVNPACGSVVRKEVDSPQLELTSVREVNKMGHNCSRMELTVAPEVSKSQLLSSHSADPAGCECVPLSSMTIRPEATEPWYLMDSERFEVMAARLTLLKDRVKVFTYDDVK